MRWVGSWFRPLLAVALMVTLAGCTRRDPETVDIAVHRARLAALRDHDFFQTIRIVDRQGRLLAEHAPHGQRIWVGLDAIPVWVQQAVIATEDQTFAQNAGIDAAAVGRAMLQNARAGTTVSGASTITMQLVRMVAFDPEERFQVSLERKVREAHLAAEIAEQYSKDEILEAYLNLAYFGNRAYGIEAAARTYFARPARELTVAQATLLVGLLQAPAYLDPYRNLAGAVARQAVVVNLMVDAGYLTPAEAEAVRNSPLDLVAPPAPPPRRAQHFVDYVLETLPQVLGPRLAARGGFTLTTTLDLELTERLRDIATAHVARLQAEHNVSDAAIVVLRPASGEILAMVGGLDYNEPRHGQVNMATSPRQPGSAFKPITYAAALDAGWTPADLVWDIPWSFPLGNGNVYRPHNYDGTYRGPVRLRQALGNSLNAAAVHLLAETGVTRVHQLALQLGLPLDPDPWHYGLSLTLGGAEVPLVSLTGAFGALANGGQYVPPTAVLRADPLDGGAPLYELKPQPQRVITPETAWLISDILADPTARRPAFAGGPPLEVSRPAAVKTGTSNGFRDNLTVGYTPYLVIGVWTGNKDGRPMRNVLGITGAAPIWHDAMETVFADRSLMRLLGDGEIPDDGFSRPPTIIPAPVCDLATLTVAGRCRTVQEVFSAATAFRDAGRVFQWASVRSANPTGGTGRCAEPGAVASGRQTVYLAVPRDPELARQVRQWATEHGVRAMPPPCHRLQGAVAQPGDGRAVRLP